MKYSELVSAFEAYTGVVGEIDDADLAIWFNEAQLDLSQRPFPAARRVDGHRPIWYFYCRNSKEGSKCP